MTNAEVARGARPAAEVQALLLSLGAALAMTGDAVSEVERRLRAIASSHGHPGARIGVLPTTVIVALSEDRPAGLGTIDSFGQPRVIRASREPAMIVPILERSDAELAPGAPALSVSDWTDGQDPYAATAALLDEDGRYAISDSAWAMHVLGLQSALPQSRYVSLTSALPMLRAVKDADELERLATAGAAAGA